MIFTKKDSLAQRYRYSVILLKELVRTDFKIRYQSSVLGYIWAVLRPLFLFIVLYFVFVYFLRIGRGIEHWPVAMLLGIVMWNFFGEVTNQGLKAIVSQGDMLRKINFPKYVVLLAVSLSAFINLLINLLVVGIFMVISGVTITWSILLLPLFIAQIFIFALGVAFILSTLYVRFRDINFVWDVIMQALFYGSAIIFPISRVVEQSELLAKLMLLNPISQTLQEARRAAISTEMTTMGSLTDNPLFIVTPYILVVLTIAVGAQYFRRRSPNFAEAA